VTDNNDTAAVPSAPLDPVASSGSHVAGAADTGPFEELRAAIASGDYSAAAQIVRDSWFTLATVHGDRLIETLEAIPPAELRDYPLLVMLLGIAYNVIPHRRITGLRYFVAAVRAARVNKRNIQPVDRALIMASQSAAYRLIGRPKAGVGPARAALRILDALSVDERGTIHVLTRVYAQLGITLYYAGEIDDALETFEKGLAESPTQSYGHGFSNLSMLAGIHAINGDLPESRHYIDLARAGDWTDVQRSWYPGTFYRVAEAIDALEAFDAELSRTHLEAMVHDRRTIEHWIAIAVTEAMTLLVAGRPGDALSALDAFAAMRGAEGRSSATRANLASTRAVLQLALGNPDAAGVILRRDAGPGPARHVGRARVHLYLGQYGAALQEIRAIAGVPQSSRTLAEATMIEATALLRFSTRPRAAAAVEHLGALLEHTGLRLPLGLVPPTDLERVIGALSERGYGHLMETVAPRSFLPDPQLESVLTDRELAVLEGLMRTPSAAQIASELVVSVNTVKTQLKSTYRKLGVSTRDEAIAVAIDRHLLVRTEE
jgi:DNA-binding CsgD family transcriptional regulator/tetratricopeptide (TPR) repeat protein